MSRTLQFMHFEYISNDDKRVVACIFDEISPCKKFKKNSHCT